MKRFFYITCLILIFLCSVTKADDFTLKSIETTLKGSLCEPKAIQKLIPFYDGQKLSDEQFEIQITKINSLNLFSHVDYELFENSKTSKSLKLMLTCSPRVRNISVKGNYPFLSKDIIKLIPLQPGSAFDSDLIPTSEESVNKYLKKNGFYESKITLKTKDIKNEPTIIDLVIEIKKGRTYRYRDVFVEGNTALSRRRIKNIIQHWARFKPTQLKDDINHIKDIYAKKGYIKARVKVEKVFFDRDKNKVDLYLSVRENRKLSIQIKGSPYYPPERIKNVTQLYERRSYDRYALRQAQKRLIKYYQKNGFLDPKVNFEIQKPSKKEIVAIFTVNPGQQVLVKDIQIKGNRDLSDGKIKESLETKQNGLFEKAYFNQKLVNNDRFRILKEYKDLGYFDAFVEPAQIETNSYQDQKTITFKINEGKAYKIEQIQIVGNEKVEALTLLEKIKIKVGQEYSQEGILNAKNKILDELQSQGYAYSTVTSKTEVKRDEHALYVTFTIYEGPVVRINSISIFGNVKTKESKITDTIRLKNGSLFNYQKMLDSQLRLRRLGVFRSVRLIPMGYDSGNPTIDLVVNVTERKSLIVNIQGGYDNRYLATGQIGLTKLNPFGKGNQISARAIGGPRYNRGEVTLFFPQVFGANWNLSNQYFGQYDDQPNFAAVSAGGYVNTLKNFGSHFTFGFQEQITRTDLLDSRSNSSALGNALFDNTFNEFSVLGVIDYRDNFSDPQKGFYILAQNEISSDLSDLNNQFNTIEVNLSHYFGFFNNRFTLVNSFRYGHILGLGSKPRVPANKLFFLGGADTLRGFTEDGVNPAGGTVSLIYNTELHLKLRDSIKLAGFFDMGALGINMNQLNGSNVRESAGVGLRYFTPLGPVRLDWGFILNRLPGEPRSRINFSFGYFY